MIRLSTAHWFTPSGRLVQKPYDKGRGEYYAIRYRNPDSTADGKREAFKTLGGRTVYASSGITPNSVMEERIITGATARLMNARIPFMFAPKFIRDHNLKTEGDFEWFRRNATVDDADLQGMIAMAKRRKLYSHRKR